MCFWHLFWVINTYYGIRLGRGEFFLSISVFDLQCLCYLEFSAIWRNMEEKLF